MPFQSEAQRRFLYSQHPDIAARFQAETPAGRKLPQKKYTTKKFAQLARTKRHRRAGLRP